MKNIKLFSTYFKTSYIHTWTTVMVVVSFGVRDEERQPRRTASSISGGKMGWSGSVTQHNCLYTQSYLSETEQCFFAFFVQKLQLHLLFLINHYKIL